MELAELAARLRRELLADEELAFDPEGFVVRPVLNYGGFVNRSFTATDGATTLQVKLADGSGTHRARRRLERWRSLHAELSEHYRAPRMRGWIELTGTPFAGPIFEWIEGQRPAALDPDLRRRLVDTVHRLHADVGLADRLTALGDRWRTCAEAYRSTYHERFVEDLEFIRRDRPSFRSASELDWMSGQAAELVRGVEASPAFGEPAAVPVHGDLWLDNLLVGRDGSLAILDWDELELGDPMVDWAMLFGPSRDDLEPVAAEPTDLPDLSPAELERLTLYARASLLDWVIDPLADWVQAKSEPEHGTELQKVNRRTHERALELYRGRYRASW